MWLYVYMNILYVLFFDWPFNLIFYLGKLKYLLYAMCVWNLIMNKTVFAFEINSIVFSL